MFTADGRASNAVAADASARTCQAIKFISFVEKNNDAPFIVKRKIFMACVTSSLLYGCETWLNADIRPIKRLYNMCLKALLGVRRSTSNELCMAELGLPQLEAMVQDRQRSFFQGVSASREQMVDDPLGFTLRTALNHNTPTSRYIRALIANPGNEKDNSITRNQNTIRANTRLSTRYEWFKTVNPHLTTHRIYESRDGTINELHRIAWTRLRLSAHSLAIEEGRWNRRGRGRLPVEERLCPCGAVQDERHVLQDCPTTAHIRQEFVYGTVEEFLEKNDDVMTNIAYRVLNAYRN